MHKNQVYRVVISHVQRIGKIFALELKSSKMNVIYE